MTSGQPPQPPYGGERPEHAHQPPPPASSYGQQSSSGQYGPPPGYGPVPAPYGPPGGSGTGFSFDLRRLTTADYGVAGGTLLFFVLALFPWWNFGDALVDYNLSGFDDGTVSTAFLLFLLAAVWTLLPAFVDLRLGFPRGWVTVGLAGVGFVLTLTAWIDSMGVSLQVWPLLGMLTAGAILLFAILSLLPQLRNRPRVPGGPVGAAPWADQPAPDVGYPGLPHQGPSTGGPSAPHRPAGG